MNCKYKKYLSLPFSYVSLYLFDDFDWQIVNAPKSASASTNWLQVSVRKDLQSQPNYMLSVFDNSTQPIG